MTQYDLSCLFNGSWFDMFNCLNVASNYVLLYVLLVVVFLIVIAIDYGIEKEAKNGLLLASAITAVVSIGFLMGAAASGYSSTIIVNYSGTAIFCSVMALGILIYHVLSGLR